MWPVIHFIPAFGSWVELIVKAVVGGTVYVVVVYGLDAAGARQFIKQVIAKK